MKEIVGPRYCNLCGKTTQHRGTKVAQKCLRCNTLKHLVKRPIPVRVEDLLDEALGLLNEAVDKPEPPKPEGEEMASTEGAHRPDKGAKFIQMRYDDQFLTKANHKTLKP